MRIGFGYDVHKFSPKRRLVLGGVEIKYEKGLEGHSDADVLIHAICDAILGAIGAGDIGRHFPPDDPQYKDISSIILLKRVAEISRDMQFLIVNIDSTIVVEKPILKDFISQMEENISTAIDIPVSCVNVKATTSEGLGFVGKGEGIVAYAIALVSKPH